MAITSCCDVKKALGAGTASRQCWSSFRTPYSGSLKFLVSDVSNKVSISSDVRSLVATTKGRRFTAHISMLPYLPRLIHPQGRHVCQQPLHYCPVSMRPFLCLDISGDAQAISSRYCRPTAYSELSTHIRPAPVGPVPLPLIGNLLGTPRRNYHLFYSKWAQKYGKRNIFERSSA